MAKQKKQLKLPIDAVVAVTYRCNSRCVMCNIWQIKDFPEMAPESYLKLPAGLKDVNISGGEPFLRNDLDDIIKNIKKACPKAHLIISSNGFLTDAIKKMMPKILKIDPDIGISISVDGIGQMHETVRRVPNAWPKVVEIIRYLRDILKMNNIKLAFTLNKENYLQLSLAYNWCKRLGVQFTMAVAHSSEIYFGKKNLLKGINKELLQKEFDYVIEQLLNSISPKDWIRAYFVDGLYKIARGEKRPLESYAGHDFFYMDPKGDVYPSVIDNIIMGNIFDFRQFESLWFSKRAKQAREDILGFESNYWMVCTARSAIRRNPLKVADWIFKNKLNWKR